MALKTEDQKPISKLADCKLETKKPKSQKTRKKYSAKKTELKVRKRHISKDTKNPEGCIKSDLGTMFYPPTYYPVTFNGWATGMGPMNVHSLPVIVNPLLSTQICPYTPIVLSPVTVSNEFPIPPIVPMTNEFPLLTNDASPLGTPNELPLYCETVNHLPQYPNSAASYTPVSNEGFLDVPLTPLSSDYSPLLTYGYEYSTSATPISDVFSPIQNMQIPREFIPLCGTEISPPCITSEYGYYDHNLTYLEENIGETKENKDFRVNSLEFYLSLPKDLFPSASMLTIDPNSIIDEFCKVPDLDVDSWILDLEFGIPKTPVSRRVAIYDVKLNSIHCKNTPEAIHPGFEKCDKDLKRVLMFYYDCVISNWYRGYMALFSDGSVENFQTWLLQPMQVLGMCWS